MMMSIILKVAGSIETISFLTEKKHLVTLRLRKASPNKRINEIEVDGNQKKNYKNNSTSLCKSTFFTKMFIH